MAIGKATVQESADRFASKAIIRKAAQPEDVTGMVLWLASPEAQFATAGGLVAEPERVAFLTGLSFRAGSYVIDGGLANI